MSPVFTLNTTALPVPFFGAVAAIGNFDAVHHGHQMLLEIARSRAAELKKPFVVVTFEPHPRSVFRPDDAPFRITPDTVKYDRLSMSGCDAICVIPFTPQLAQMNENDFVTHYLKNIIGTQHCVIGADFHFGHDRKGSIETLRAHHIDCTIADLMKDSSGGIYSASRIRGLIQSGLMSDANSLLGWQWEIRGEVIHGDKRGRTIGFPTANMVLGDTIHPSYGVYAAKVRIGSDTSWHMAAINIGLRPMFEIKTPLVESHILDFNGDLYGQILHVCPLSKLRGEAKYPNLESLVAQIAKDCAATRDYFTQNP